MNVEKRAFSETEASEYIGMSRSYLRQSRMDGQIGKRKPAPPFIKIGRTIRYLKEDLDAWLNSFCRASNLTELEVRHD
jgi:predicted DNA-binding transcriptional regulator AlpA